MRIQFRLTNYSIFDSCEFDESDSNSDTDIREYTKQTVIQTYGLDESGKTYSVFVHGYEPFFYLKVGDNWSKGTKTSFIEYLKTKIGPYYESSISSHKLVKRKTLYGFDNGKTYKFVGIKFKNLACYNKVKNLFYKKTETDRYVVPLKFNGIDIHLYEANIPPLLRFFHTKKISPAGWLMIPEVNLQKTQYKKTTCHVEYDVNIKHIVPLPDKETSVPFKICSFDIEAMSSHGDFPQAVKDYKKLATQIYEYWRLEIPETDEEVLMMKSLILAAFGFKDCDYIDIVYIKETHSESKISEAIDKILNKRIVSIINDPTQEKDLVIEKMNQLLSNFLPDIKGDEVTFIGSTFVRYGENEPYMNHCVVQNTCDYPKESNENVVIQSCKNEKELLSAWSKIIQKENPDIIIGYNIFGFDYKFMHKRAESYGPGFVNDFMKLSRNKDEICTIKESSITIASGSHDLYYINMEGRLQVDLYNYFRREYNLESYKLDYASGYFIRDTITTCDKNVLKCKSINGVKVGDFIQIEEIGHSSEFYHNGEKFKILELDAIENTIHLNKDILPDTNKTLKWCLAKDDVSPQDIFRMTNEGPEERGVIAKYCIQDCNIVHYLLNKIDVITGFVEMANLCSIPIDYVVLRGQGIKLFSFIAKQCSEVKTLIPVINKSNDGGYEGAIVLDPKCGLYLNEPVACVDYSSLYPSSMISENLSHDSKVWSKMYNLKGECIKETGFKVNGTYVYDDLPGFEYVDIQYDTFQYIRKTEKAALTKIKDGYKIVRFAQFPDGKKAIMPTILEELLKARKQTRTMAKYKTIQTSIGDYNGIIIEKTDTHISLKTKQNEIKIIETKSVKTIKDTYDTFMKNVLDKRQLAIKVTANSLYGQCGAKTSSFYEQDVAASTTSTGRKLLTYAQKVVENVYGDRICETKYGKVHSHAEYVYGDSVLGDTPILLRRTQNNHTIRNKSLTSKLLSYNEDNHGKFILQKRIDQLGKQWTKYEGFKIKDSEGRTNKEQCNTLKNRYEIWTKSGWKSLKRVIRHRCNKKIYRVVTNVGVIDATEDHSLINNHGEYIKPQDLSIGECLYYKSVFANKDNTIIYNGYKTLLNTLSYHIPLVNKYMNKSSRTETIKQYFCHKKIMEWDKYSIKSFIYGLFCSIKFQQDDMQIDGKLDMTETFTIYDDDKEWCVNTMSILCDEYGDNFILKECNEKDKQRYCITSTNATEIWKDYAWCINKHGESKVPNIVFNQSTNEQYAFLIGYLYSYKNKYVKNIEELHEIVFICKTKELSSGLFHLLERNNMRPTFVFNKKKNMFNIKITDHTSKNIDKCIITDIYVLKEKETNFVYDIETEDGTFNCGYPIIIKNTDSVFMSFKLTDLDGNKIEGKEALKHTIELAKEVGKTASKFLKAPHDLEYEKTFMPFCLLSKKRYVGMLYEDDPNTCYRKSMGIVLKRRDNAPIVKDVYGGIIDILMKNQNIEQALQYTKDCLNNIINEKYPLEKLIITKSLRSYYKKPQQIAHKVLADRMGQRDSGNKPSSGDRIPYVYIVNKSKKKPLLQGDKIEHPNYIREHNIKPDYGFYITNQIMKPVMQLFGLIAEQIPSTPSGVLEYESKMKQYKLKISKLSTEDYQLKLLDYKGKEVKRLIFDGVLRKLNNSNNSQKSIMGFFS